MRTSLYTPIRGSKYSMPFLTPHVNRSRLSNTLVAESRPPERERERENVRARVRENCSESEGDRVRERFRELSQRECTDERRWIHTSYHTDVSVRRRPADNSREHPNRAVIHALARMSLARLLVRTFVREKKLVVCLCRTTLRTG
jgi:hypothetical protein